MHTINFIQKKYIYIYFIDVANGMTIKILKVYCYPFR